jgi:hypothetical protein
MLAQQDFHFLGLSNVPVASHDSSACPACQPDQAQVPPGVARAQAPPGGPNPAISRPQASPSSGPRPSWDRLVAVSHRPHRPKRHGLQQYRRQVGQVAAVGFGTGFRHFHENCEPWDVNFGKPSCVSGESYILRVTRVLGYAQHSRAGHEWCATGSRAPTRDCIDSLLPLSPHL